MNTMKVKTNGTHCQSCSMLIEMNVDDLEGVESVRADYATDVTTVTFDPSQVTDVEILRAIASAGYGAERVG